MNKLGLNRRGHLIFSLGLVLFSVYFFNHYFKINYLFLLFHAPFFFFGVVFPDLIEMPTNAWHRGLLHKGFLLVLIPLSVLILYYFWSTSIKFNFMGINFNYYSIGIAILLGWLTHLYGDALTSKLR